MEVLKTWGVIELKPLMWLTIWRNHIEKFANNKYTVLDLETKREPKRSKRYRKIQFQRCRPRLAQKKRQKKPVKRNLFDDFQEEPCELDPNQPTQYCKTHWRKMVHCYINTNTDKEWDNMITANNSPRRSIDDIIEISDDEEDGETTQEPILFITERLSPQQYKKKKTSYQTLPT